VSIASNRQDHRASESSNPSRTLFPTLRHSQARRSEVNVGLAARTAGAESRRFPEDTTRDGNIGGVAKARRWRHRPTCPSGLRVSEMSAWRCRTSIDATNIQSRAPPPAPWAASPTAHRYRVRPSPPSRTTSASRSRLPVERLTVGMDASLFVRWVDRLQLVGTMPRRVAASMGARPRRYGARAPSQARHGARRPSVTRAPRPASIYTRRMPLTCLPRCTTLRLL
jgi:hypothetical protein